MADWVITRRITGDDQLIDADAPPVFTYGVRSLVDDSLVVPAGTPMVRDSVGTYSYTVTGLTPGTSYIYTLAVTVNGRVYSSEDDHTIPLEGTDSLERWRVSGLPTFRPVLAGDVRHHLRLRSNNDDDSYLEMLIDAATGYAEEAMGMALSRQTITARFEVGEAMVLPRGPVAWIESVRDADGNGVPFVPRRDGNTFTIVPTRGLSTAATVVYAAGYESAALIPADIRLAILAHVGTLYEARESTTDKARTAVPHSLEAFYQRRSRQRGIA